MRRYTKVFRLDPSRQEELVEIVETMLRAGAYTRPISSST